MIRPELSRTACRSAVSAALLVSSTAAVAQPTLSFEEAQTDTPGVYVAGETFDLNLMLSFSAEDLSPDDASDDLIGDIAFNLGLTRPAGSGTAGGISLTGIEAAGGLFNFFDTTNPLALDPVTTSDVNPIGLFDFFNTSTVGPGTSLVGTYTFAVAAETPGGDFTISDAFEFEVDDVDSVQARIVSALNPNTVFADATIIPFDFGVVAVPEPTTLALLLPAAGLALTRRRR